jgi:hypothetical protein
MTKETKKHTRSNDIEPKIVELEGGTRVAQHSSMVRAKSLQNLIPTIPEVENLLKDMEKNLQSWIDFINKSLMSLKENKVLP